MTAVEAIIYCLGFINETPEDSYYHSQFCLDKNGIKHWIEFATDDDDSSPKLCTESCLESFSKCAEPYST